MTFGKRIFDIIVALMLGVFLLPVMIVVGVLIRVLDGGPVFYVSERMKTPVEPFWLYKFRTMKPAADDYGVSGGDKVARITRTGRFLRRTRLDEVPQLWNVLRGDISFVGPRPPLRSIVERYPEIYGKVLRSRPGITGMASILYHKHEERLLAGSTSSEETHALYTRVCVPRKAQLDLIYQERRSLCLDMLLMLKTVFRRVPLRLTRRS